MAFGGAEHDGIATLNGRDLLYGGVELDMCASLTHALLQHGDDLFGGGVTK